MGDGKEPEMWWHLRDEEPHFGLVLVLLDELM